jgi:tetratricopeptide (TPR) repeat protein
VGADKARRRDDAPARRPAPKVRSAPRPDLPVDDRPNLPKPVKKDLERTLGAGRRTDEVALALSVGSQAIDEGALDLALEYLAWAKDQAPRVGAIREAYGVARYLSEDYSGALTELQAYVRISGRNDQNHVIADCHRALGRDLDRIEEAARSLLDDDRAPADRRAEAAIVLAAALGDAGRAADGLEVLRPVLTARRDRDLDHHLRVRSLVADLAVQVGDQDAARRQLEVLLAADDDGTFEARERLDALDAR